LTLGKYLKSASIVCLTQNPKYAHSVACSGLNGGRNYFVPRDMSLMAALEIVERVFRERGEDA